MLTKPLRALGLLCLLPSLAFSQPKDPAAPAQLRDIVITASRLDLPLSRTPFAVSVLEGTDLEGLSKNVAADEALRAVPGLRVENATDGERVHLYIRGCGVLTETGVRGTRVILDGIPLNDPSGFVPDLYDVDWATVRRIEVLRGPAASLYGASASCGVVNIETRRGGPSPAAVEGVGMAGSNRFRKTVGQFSGAAGPADYRVDLSEVRGDGFRIHQRYRGENLYAKGDINLGSDVRLTPVFAWTRYFNENPEGLSLDQLGADPGQANPDAVPKNEYWRTERVTGGLSGQIGLTPDQHIAFSAYTRWTDFTESVPASVSHEKIFSPGGSVQYTYLYEGSGFNNHASAGSDFELQTIGEYKRKNLGGAVEDPADQARQSIHQDQTGVFLADALELGEKLALTGSARYDAVGNRLYDNLASAGDLSGRKNFNEFTGRFGVTYSLIPEANLYANWGQGFLPPSTNELIANPDHFGGFNQILVPAQSQSEEIGVRGAPAPGRFSYDLAFFHMSTKNDFNRYRVPTRPLETFYSNVGPTDRFGVELHAKASPVKPVTIQASYTYSDFRYENNDPIVIPMDAPLSDKLITKGSRIPNIPVHQADVEARYDILSGLNFIFGADARSHIYIDGANVLSESAPGFALLRAKLAYHWAARLLEGSLSLGVENLLDRKYVAFTEPDSGGNSYQPAPGREVFFNVALRWDPGAGLSPK